ncbi:hypothetical protein TRFO_16808 [Tritrichomonas foetus]|uniref:Ricin B lectin domain-containing protein n=1 Tax=Tritrichomonas foetus TaxID=1144522 RepID=A0A1J4KPV8_9EUKA|nr:hypothetical protein TRFO_16808 [Tritrichomonas foetus]|eukprot:OHT13146.1 hypothetical protein TRFO_16808 [Tritrichomonas foetus]
MIQESGKTIKSISPVTMSELTLYLKMMFLFWLPFEILSQEISYGSSVQIKNVYTKNRLGVTTNTDAKSYTKPTIYSSRPPYDEGWLWTIEPDEENSNLTRTTVPCDSIVALSSTSNEAYLSTRKTKKGLIVEATSSNQGIESQWVIKCPTNYNIWEQNMQFQLFNLKNKCYLTTSFEKKIQANKYFVTCENVTSNSIWKVAEGIFLDSDQSTDEGVSEGTSKSDEL